MFYNIYSYIKMLQSVSKPGTNIMAEIYEYDWDERIKERKYPHDCRRLSFLALKGTDRC